MTLAALLRSQLGKFRQYLADRRERWQGLRARVRESSLSKREVRGVKLLCEWLSADQLRQFKLHGHFEVTGCHTGTRYRIRYGAASNIHELDERGKPRAGWCFVPTGTLVAGDVMLAQKIALETDEQNALQVAKRFPPPNWC